jgi:hypothetical protein
MEKRLTADLNVVANSNLEIQLLDGDLNIIQKLDDEPNDVGGLTSAELKAKFDESGNIIKKYINETLIPAVLTDDATEESRKQAEAARVAAEQGRVTAEEGRVSAETARAQAEIARQSAETARSGAESTRQSKETARQTAETARANAETDRQAAETRRGEAETARASAESERRNAESSRVTAEGGRASAEASRVTAEQGRTSAESIRVQNERKRVSAENSRVEAEAQRAAAEQARADENTGIVAQATAQANAAAQSAGIASASAQTAQSASSSAGTAASTASSAASTASTAAEAASGSASQASAAATAAAGSAAGAETASKTAQSWAVGGTGTRPGEDTDNAKYWAEQAQAVAGGDFATKVEAQGYVTAHNQSVDAHRDIRNALNNKETAGAAATAVTAHNEDSTAHADIREALNRKAETFVIQANANVSTSGITISNVDKTLDEVNAAREAGKAIRLKLIMDSEAYQELPLLVFFQVSQKFIYTFSGASTSNAASVQLTFEGDSVRAIVTKKEIFGLSDNAPAAPGTTSAGTSDLAARADHVHPKEVSDTDRATWNGKADLVDGKVPTSQLPEISSVKTYTATIGTTWVEDENTGVKTQSVAIAGVKATNTATVDHVYTGAGTSDDYAAFVEAENQYLNCITNGYAETYNGGIKFTIFGDANTVAIPIVAEVR